MPLPLTPPAPDYLNPYADPLSWDTVRVAGLEVGPRVAPMKAVVSGGERDYEWDRKKGKGASGETSTYVQKPASDIDVEIEIFASNQADGAIAFGVWYALVRILRYNVLAGGLTALDIEHPGLSSNDVNSIVVDKIRPPRHQGGGRWTMGFAAHEYAPPPPVSITTTPNTSLPVDDSTVPGFTIPPAVKTAADELENENSKARAMGLP